MIDYDGKARQVLMGAFMYFNIEALKIEQKSNYNRRKSTKNFKLYSL